MLHAILGHLIDGGIYDRAMKHHEQVSLPIFMDDRMKGVDENGETYDYSEFPPKDVILAVLEGEVHPHIRYYNPNVNNNFSADPNKTTRKDKRIISAKDVTNGEHLIPGVNPNILVTADGKTHAQVYKVDVPAKYLNVSPKDLSLIHI